MQTITREKVRDANALMNFKRYQLYKAGMKCGLKFGRNPTHADIAAELATKAYLDESMADAIANTLHALVNGEPEPDEVEPEREPKPEPKGSGDDGKSIGDIFDAAIRKQVSEAMETLRAEIPEGGKVPPVKININDHPVKELPEDTIIPNCFERICQLVRMRKPVLIVGMAGSGKTTVAEMAFKALDMRSSKLKFSEGVREQDITGYLLPTGENGQFEYTPSEFIQAYQHRGDDEGDGYKGWGVILDDVDRGDANTLAALHPFLDNSGETSIPHKIDKDGQTVKQGKGFSVIATANSWGHGSQQYVDANALGQALLDRFRIGQVRFDYDDNIEEKIVDPEVLQWGRDLRKRMESAGLSRFISTRFMREATEMMQGAKWTMTEVKQAFYADWTDEERKRISA